MVWSELTDNKPKCKIPPFVLLLEKCLNFVQDVIVRMPYLLMHNELGDDEDIDRFFIHASITLSADFEQSP